MQKHKRPVSGCCGREIVRVSTVPGYGLDVTEMWLCGGCWAWLPVEDPEQLDEPEKEANDE